MKRIGMLVSWILLLYSTPMMLPAAPVASETYCCTCDELPWETVDAVLKRVDELYVEYEYGQLVEWYHGGLLTVEQSGSSYVVTIYDEEGIVDVLILDSF